MNACDNLTLNNIEIVQNYLLTDTSRRRAAALDSDSCQCVVLEVERKMFVLLIKLLHGVSAESDSGEFVADVT